MRHASLWRRVAVSVAPVARELAAWVFAAVWAAAVLWLWAHGHDRLASAAR